MRLLLDTHVLLWMFSDDVRLSPDVRVVLENTDNVLYYSDVSIWEVAIKHAAHPVDNLDAGRFFELCSHSDLHLLSIKTAHILAISKLEQIHRDPFDRLLLAQALFENMTFVSHDRFVSQYSTPMILSF